MSAPTAAGYGRTSWKRLNASSPFSMPPRRRGLSIYPGTVCTRLRGTRKGCGRMVRANWRIIFRFEAGDALDVELIDYH